MSDTAALEQQSRQFLAMSRKIKTEMARVIVGQDSVIDGLLQGLFAGGHVLLEGVPGLGKTRIMLALSRLLNVSFNRIQFTPDLMPADITGTRILVESPGGGKSFEFQKGPLFANIVLADEINRATPKTQSALLEAMQEHTVTVAGTTYPLPNPFFVLATQNPIEMEGTYPLPEAQLDRFLLKIAISIGTAKELVEILDRTTSERAEELIPIMDAAQLSSLICLVRRVIAAKSTLGYAANTALLTQPKHPNAPELVRKYVRYGASPRGAQAMVLAAKVRALTDGRYNVSVDDLKAVGLAALRHRIILNFEGQTAGVTADDIVHAVLDVAKPEIV